MGESEKLRATITVLEVAGGLTYADRLEFARVAGKAGDWELSLEQAEAAIPLITREQVLAQYSTAREVRPEKLEEDTRRVRHTALLMKGWSLVELGRRAEGIEVFAEVERESSYSFLGIPENAVNQFWGRALIRESDFDGAMRRLAPGAVIAGRDSELALMRTAYRGKHGSLDDFEKTVENLRRELAPPIGDFTLNDYEGRSFAFSSLADRVVLISFWFPACHGCVEKLPHLETLYRAHRQSGFDIVAIDFRADRENALPLLRKHGVSFITLANGQGEDELVLSHFRVRVFPVTWLVDRRGRIVRAWDWQQELDFGLLEQLVTALLDDESGN